MCYIIGKRISDTEVEVPFFLGVFVEGYEVWSFHRRLDGQMKDEAKQLRMAEPNHRKSGAL